MTKTFKDKAEEFIKENILEESKYKAVQTDALQSFAAYLDSETEKPEEIKKLEESMDCPRAQYYQDLVDKINELVEHANQQTK